MGYAFLALQAAEKRAKHILSKSNYLVLQNLCRRGYGLQPGLETLIFIHNFSTGKRSPGGTIDRLALLCVFSRGPCQLAAASAKYNRLHVWRCSIAPLK
jgi:hypothetical protein